MPVMKLKRHEEFARNIGIKGMSAAEAYRTGWPKASNATAETTGPKLMRDSQIALRIEELRQEAAKRAAEKDFLTVEEKRRFLADIVRTPVGEVDESSHLCQEFSFEIVSSGGLRGKLKRGNAASGNAASGKEVAEPPREKLKFKMPSKLDAIKLDNDLAVDGAEAKGNEALASALERIRSVTHA